MFVEVVWGVEGALMYAKNGGWESLADLEEEFGEGIDKVWWPDWTEEVGEDRLGSSRFLGIKSISSFIGVRPCIHGSLVIKSGGKFYTDIRNLL